MREMILILIVVGLSAVVVANKHLVTDPLKEERKGLIVELSDANKRVSDLEVRVEELSQQLAEVPSPPSLPSNTEVAIEPVVAPNPIPLTNGVEPSVMPDKRQEEEERAVNRAAVSSLIARANEWARKADHWQEELRKRENENDSNRSERNGVVQSEANMQKLRDKVNAAIRDAREQSAQLESQANQIKQ